MEPSGGRENDDRRRQRERHHRRAQNGARQQVTAHRAVTWPRECFAARRQAANQPDRMRKPFGIATEQIRHVRAAPRPEGADDGGDEAGLRRLEEAVQSDDMPRIRAALGAALAEEAIGSVREFEARLARALDDLTNSFQALTPHADQAAARPAA